MGVPVPVQMQVRVRVQVRVWVRAGVNADTIPDSFCAFLPPPHRALPPAVLLLPQQLLRVRR